MWLLVVVKHLKKKKRERERDRLNIYASVDYFSIHASVD